MERVPARAQQTNLLPLRESRQAHRALVVDPRRLRRCRGGAFLPEPDAADELHPLRRLSSGCRIRGGGGDPAAPDGDEQGVGHHRDRDERHQAGNGVRGRDLVVRRRVRRREGGVTGGGLII
ncbi:transcriptional regulator WhiB [Striga asiatica]|uniref:Transcriptional regulator WhiB n=1 Tax=Striga asiatica TaxID=4170 RepID=A0A5A7RJ58_STRAF|nr:transcriptional regulator WhiB [Striga asiatica]